MEHHPDNLEGIRTLRHGLIGACCRVGASGAASHHPVAPPMPEGRGRGEQKMQNNDPAFAPQSGLAPMDGGTAATQTPAFHGCASARP